MLELLVSVSSKATAIDKIFQNVHVSSSVSHLAPGSCIINCVYNIRNKTIFFVKKNSKVNCKICKECYENQFSTVSLPPTSRLYQITKGPRKELL